MVHDTTCCIAGGGPAGMMLGFLLARAGVDTVVLEKHQDFLRDFRGDTIHPSTLELMHELGVLDEFLALPHQKVSLAAGQFGDTPLAIADFSHLPTRCKFIAFMPQWDFLNFIAEKARAHKTFHLNMETEASELVRADGRVAGLRAHGPSGPLEFRARLVVACDGRHSTLRARSGLEVVDLGAPMDVLWFHLARRPDDSGQVFGRFDRGKGVVLLNRGDYWQCGLIIRKGGLDEIKRAGLPALRAELARLVPFLRERVDGLTDWEQIKLLSVQVNRLKRWHLPGLLCIGDAAHAMSPIGGVGINLAVQDAVAAANILFADLREGRAPDELLQRVQRRRELPTRLTQAAQVTIQNFLARNLLAGTGPVTPPWPVRLLNRFPFLRRLPARVIGLGFRPEHIRTPELTPPAVRAMTSGLHAPQHNR